MKSKILQNSKFLLRIPYYKELLLIFFIILVNNLLFIFNSGLYWDDWVGLDNLITTSSVGRFKIFNIIDVYKLHPSNTRFLLFINEIVFTYCIFMICKENKYLKTYAMYISLFSVTIPIYMAKYTLCCADYYFSLGFFYLGFYLQTKYTQINFKKSKFKKIILGILSIFLYIKSFQTASCFVFYIVPFIYNFYLSYKENILKINKIFFSNLFKYCLKNLHFLLLPFIIFLIRSLFFPPTGVYATGYYSIKIINIVKSPIHFIQQTYGLFSDYLAIAYDLFSKPLLFVFPIYVFFNIKIKNKFIRKNINYKLFFVIILTIAFFATFAYASLGFTGILFSGFESRHLLLLGLPLSLFIMFLILVCCTKKSFINIKKIYFFFTLLITIFTYTNIYIGYKFYKDQLVQDSIIELLKESKTIEENEVFTLSFPNYTPFQGTLAFYETSGYAYKAYNTRNHLIVMNIPVYTETLSELYSIKDNLDYKYKDITHSTIDGNITFTTNFSKKKALTCLFYQLTNNRSKYFEEVKKLGKFDIILY